MINIITNSFVMLGSDFQEGSVACRKWKGPREGMEGVGVVDGIERVERGIRWEAL